MLNGSQSAQTLHYLYYITLLWYFATYTVYNVALTGGVLLNNCHYNANFCLVTAVVSSIESSPSLLCLGTRRLPVAPPSQCGTPQTVMRAIPPHHHREPW